MKRYVFAAALCLASPALAQPATAPDFVKAAGAGDLYERQSSQLVLQSTKNVKVRAFATMMVKDATISAKGRGHERQGRDHERQRTRR